MELSWLPLARFAVRPERYRVDRIAVTDEGASIRWWLATSHSLTVLSALPLANVTSMVHEPEIMDQRLVVALQAFYLRACTKNRFREIPSCVGRLFVNRAKVVALNILITDLHTLHHPM
jgi:hypothetical protein